MRKKLCDSRETLNDHHQRSRCCCQKSTSAIYHDAYCQLELHLVQKSVIDLLVVIFAAIPQTNDNVDDKGEGNQKSLLVSLTIIDRVVIDLSTFVVVWSSSWKLDLLFRVFARPAVTRVRQMIPTT